MQNVTSQIWTINFNNRLTMHSIDRSQLFNGARSKFRHKRLQNIKVAKFGKNWRHYSRVVLQRLFHLFTGTMDSSQSSSIYKLERENFRENVSRAEKRLEEIKMMYRNYKENLETLEDDAMSALNDTARWIERARRLHVEAAEAKQREFRLRFVILTCQI